MNDVERAWVAGVLEGEGYFGSKRTGAPVVIVEMTDHDVLERLQQVTGKGTICAPNRRQSHWKQSWKWSVQARREAAELMDEIAPLMGARRQERIRSLLAVYHENN